MAISKRLRFEILRRDNHTCRYCGATAPEVKITVDHVTPVALGGKDEATNLVAACSPCNAGKSSIPVASEIVADVADDAIRWSAAIKMVAAERQDDRDLRQAYEEWFLNKWNQWTWNDGGTRTHYELENGWAGSLHRFIDAGLEPEDIEELIDVSMNSRSNDKFRYFCGCCWKQIEGSHERARKILDRPESLNSSVWG